MRSVAFFIDASEKHSRLGIEGEDLSELIDQWPNIDDSDLGGTGYLAVNNCLIEVCHGFRISPDQWSKWFDTPMAEIVFTYRRWLALKGISGGLS